MPRGDQSSYTGKQKRKAGKIEKGYNYADTLGVPAIIPRSFFGEICDIAGEHGAKSLLLRYCDEVVRVPSPEAAIDVDTPAELAAL